MTASMYFASPESWVFLKYYLCVIHAMWRSCSSSNELLWLYVECFCSRMLLQYLCCFDSGSHTGTALLMLRLDRQKRVMVMSVHAEARLGKHRAKVDSTAYVTLLFLLTNCGRSSLDSLHLPRLSLGTTI